MKFEVFYAPKARWSSQDWTDTVRKGFEYIDGQAIYGLRTKKEWLPSAMALDRIAWRLGDLTLVALKPAFNGEN